MARRERGGPLPASALEQPSEFLLDRGQRSLWDHESSERTVRAQRSSSGRTSSAFAAGRLIFTRLTPRSRNRFNRSGSSGAPPNVIERDLGSRPASSAIRRKRGR